LYIINLNTFMIGDIDAEKHSNPFHLALHSTSSYSITRPMSGSAMTKLKGVRLSSRLGGVAVQVPGLIQLGAKIGVNDSLSS
jgi:hypothetical protein